MSVRLTLRANSPVASLWAMALLGCPSPPPDIGPTTGTDQPTGSSTGASSTTTQASTESSTSGSSSGEGTTSAESGSTTNTPPAICGNFEVEPGEDCDTIRPTMTCEDIGYLGGTLTCDENCHFDTSGCCGDGMVVPPEQCDGENLQGFDCRSLGLGVGMLFCSDACLFDTSSCCQVVGASCMGGIPCCSGSCDGSVCQG